METSSDQALKDVRARLRYQPRNAYGIRHNARDNPSVRVSILGRDYLGLLATAPIREGEIVTWFDGPVFQAERASELPWAQAYNVRDRAIQAGPYEWLYASGIGLYINHSCNPNAGVAQNSFVRHRGDLIVARRNIRPGEEVAFDYAMTEDSDWRMECCCGSKLCRGTVGAYRLLDDAQRGALDGYLSPYLAERYGRR